jgi:hypothetical protein
MEHTKPRIRFISLVWTDSLPVTAYSCRVHAALVSPTDYDKAGTTAQERGLSILKDRQALVWKDFKDSTWTLPEAIGLKDWTVRENTYYLVVGIFGLAHLGASIDNDTIIARSEVFVTYTHDDYN